MRTGKAGLSSILGLALLMTPAVSRGEDVPVHILKLKKDKPVALYDCATKAQLVPAWTPGKSQEAMASKPANGWLRVQVTGQDGKQQEYCVEDWRVVTDQAEKIKAECGTTVAQRNAGTRGVGENCEAKPAAKPKH